MIKVELNEAICLECFSPDDQDVSYVKIRDLEGVDVISAVVTGSHTVESLPPRFSIIKSNVKSTVSRKGNMRLQFDYADLMKPIIGK